ncbi:hypothetical protein H8M03_09750 [Sphingomonas sabuli]|uniref:Uncharacterized protein n=1 Tax=Sphingomonas sabuli TaxID=2764186 RepID=A0A7G9L0Z6_9SPHN|nr:hypothetical protein [Sphingomonas sabuli]QNM82295.1 hypothetical protein H8M03_09750 [Sphingomonas sabuli]
MSDTLWWIVSIIGPVAMLLVLVWLVSRGKSQGTNSTTYQGTKAEYADEERRRREGTEDL